MNEWGLSPLLAPNTKFVTIPVNNATQIMKISYIGSTVKWVVDVVSDSSFYRCFLHIGTKTVKHHNFMHKNRANSV